VLHIAFDFSRAVIGDSPNGTNQRFEIFASIIYMFLDMRARKKEENRVDKYKSRFITVIKRLHYSKIVKDILIVLHNYLSAQKTGEQQFSNRVKFSR
jgi:hypothetical protein